MVKTSKQLKEERASKCDAQKGLLDTRKKEERAFTEQEQKEFNELQGDIDDLDNEIAQRETEEAAEAREAQRKLDKAANGRKNPNSLNAKEERDLMKYDFLKLVKGYEGRDNLEGLEGEMHQEAKKEAREHGQDLLGIGIPNSVSAFLVKRSSGTLTKEEKRALTVGTDADGGFTVGDDNHNTLITALRPKLVLAEAGAQTWGNLRGNVPIDSMGAVSVGWKAENETADDTTPAFTQAELTPKRCTAKSEVSNLLLAQSSYDIQNNLLNDIFNAVAAEIDRVGIEGGGTNEPTGILAAAGITQIIGGTNGFAPTYANMLALEEAVSTANADKGKLSYITNHKVRRVLKNTKIDSGSGIMTWANNEINGYKAYSTTNVPSDLTRGTGTDLSAIIFGNMMDLIFGQWGALDLVVDRLTLAEDNKTKLVVHNFVDVGIKRAASFATMKDAIT